MRRRILGYIMREINHLTKDEDLRQELWLHFLEGNSPFSLKEHLNKIKSKQNLEQEIILYTSMETLYGIEKKLQ